MNNTVEIKIVINTQQTQQQMKNLQMSINNSLNGVSSSLNQFAKNVTLGIVALKGLQMAGGAVFDFFKRGIEVTIETDKARTSIAGLIASVYEVKDATGKIVTGPEKFNEALKISGGLVKKLQLDAIKYGVSLKELTDSFQQGIGAGASKGLNLDQFRELNSLISKAGKAMLPRAGMVPQEVRSLMQGKIDKNATIGTALGFGAGGANQQSYKEALKKGGDELFKYLTEKMSMLKMAAESNAAMIGGTFNAISNVFDRLAQESSTGLAEQLNKIRTITDQIFNKDTGDFSAKFAPIVAMLDTVGKVIGSEIFNGIKKAFDMLVSFGQELLTNQSFINGLIALWENVKEIIGNVVGRFLDIAEAVFSVVGIIVNSLLPGVNTTNEQLTTTQQIMLSLNAAAGAVSITFGVIRDIVNVIIGGLKLAVGAMASVIGVVGYLLTGIEAFKKLKDIGTDIAFKDNKLMEQVSENGLIAGMFKNTFDATAKAIDGVNQSVNKTNTDFAKKIADMKKQLESGTTGKGNKGSDYDRKEALAKYEREKAILEAQINLRKEKAKEEEAVNEDNFKRNRIRAEEYYAIKKKLIQEEYSDQIALLEKEKQAAGSRGGTDEAQKIQNGREVAKIEGRILVLKEKQVNALSELRRNESNYINDKKKELEIDEASKSKLDLDNKLKLDKINQEESLALKKINQSKSLLMDKERIEAEYKNEVILLDKKKKLATDNLEQERQLKIEKEALDRKYAIDKAKIESDIFLDSKKNAMELQQTFEDGFATMVEGILTGEKSLLDSIKSFAKAIEAEFARLAAKDIAASLFGSGSTGGINLIGSVGGSVAKAFGIPGFAVGTNYVPNDMVAQIHKGEAIVPAKYNNDKTFGSQQVTVSPVFHMSGNVDQRTQMQMAQMIGAEVQKAMRRNG